MPDHLNILKSLLVWRGLSRQPKQSGCSGKVTHMSFPKYSGIFPWVWWHRAILLSGWRNILVVPEMLMGLLGSAAGSLRKMIGENLNALRFEREVTHGWTWSWSWTSRNYSLGTHCPFPLWLPRLLSITDLRDCRVIHSPPIPLTGFSDGQCAWGGITSSLIWIVRQHANTSTSLFLWVHHMTNISLTNSLSPSVMT